MELNGINSYGSDIEKKIVDAGYDNSKMEKDDFLKVLLADIKWQDPMEAKDVSEFINNTVKLREMEVLNSFESSVKALDSANASNALLMASNLINKEIKYEGDETYIKDGKTKVEFKLKENADTVKISIADRDGNIVETKTFTNLKAGKEYPFEVNNPNLKDGYYKVYINAQKDGKPVDSTIYSRALVDGVIRKDDQIKVLFGAKELEIEKILQIGG